MLLTVVMPAHDEEAYLEASVREVTEGLRDRGRSFEILVVENGSDDATAKLARSLADQLPEMTALSLPAADYGAALRQGFLRARGEVVAMFDVDLFDLGFLDRALEAMDGADRPAIVVASKRSPGSLDSRSPLRRLVTSVFSAVLRLGFGLGVSDTHGMKLLRREPLVDLARGCRFGTDLFDTELILRAERAGLAVTELPVVVEERRPSRTSVLRRIPRTVGGLVRLRLALGRRP